MTSSPLYAIPRATPSWGLAAIGTGMFMVTLDGVALNLALPSIQHQFNGTVSQLEWVVTAYTLPLASLLLTTGALGDRWGARRLFIASLLAFALASACCAASPSLPALIAARVLQGVAAAGVLPMVLSLVAKTWQDRGERARAVNTLAIVGGVAMVVGPFGGGALTQVLGWPSIFMINLPVGVLGAWLAQRHLQETPRRRAPLDLPGLAVGTLALTLLMAGLIESNTLGRTHPLVLALVAGGVLGLAGFVAIERRAPHPMLPLGIFRNASFSAAVAGGFAFQFSCYGLLFMLALFVQQAWRLSPLQAGVMLLPFAIALILTTLLLNPRVIGRGPRWMLWAGASCAVAGGIVTLGVSTHASWPVLVLGTVLMAIGTGVYSPTLNVVAATSVDTAYAGLASGVYNTARQIGMAAGIAILGSLVGGALPAAAPALTGLRIGLLLVIGCAAAIVGLTLRYIRA
ncbi:MFS transporter [Achromobacter aloeverae]|uniref:MFS transporter n=1 Tax=Achromobacter aloeverae TaxID=1750518 RepID=A0A4Q1HN62_9BURK|nr:MFS transporter [Achromobacter aloeverae]RXN91392.1 MFS transporter [Achromobacter aloeverae]